MGFFNISWTEVLVVLVIAFIILGPNRITMFGHQMGEWIRRLNKSEFFRDVLQTTDQIRNYPRKILDEAMLDQTLAEIKHEISEVQSLSNLEEKLQKEPPQDQEEGISKK